MKCKKTLFWLNGTDLLFSLMSGVNQTGSDSINEYLQKAFKLETHDVSSFRTYQYRIEKAIVNETYRKCYFNLQQGFSKTVLNRQTYVVRGCSLSKAFFNKVYRWQLKKSFRQTELHLLLCFSNKRFWWQGIFKKVYSKSLKF